MKILGSTKLDFDDVLIRPKSSETASRSAVELLRHFDRFPNSTRSLSCVPIFAANMDTTGTFAMADALMQRNWMTCLHKHYSIEELINYYTLDNSVDVPYPSRLIDCVWYSLGITDADINKLRSFLTFTNFSPNLCVDVANGYTDYFIEKLAEIRSVSQESIIMAGNVATHEMVDRVIRQGKADIVKLGIGPGSVCTTRLVTGVGYPQLSAVMESADTAHGSQHGYVCADGGCKTSGDICKAFGANADFVMLGGIFAGADECNGEWEYEWTGMNCQLFNPFNPEGDPPKTRLKYYGMSSYEAQDKYSGGPQDHRGSEGKAVYVDHKGPAEGLCKQIEGGIRSCCAYIGAKHIKDMGKCTTFVQVSRTHNTVFNGGEQWKRN